MKNWKTTVGGALAALGTLLSGSDNPTHKTIGQIVGGVGLLILGLGAKDKNVTGGTTPQ